MANEKRNMLQKEQGNPSMKHKGVTVDSDTFRNVETCSKACGRSASIDDVRRELENVIETMGPSTPNLRQTVSSDADNEESRYSTSSYSVFKIESVQREDRVHQNISWEDSQLTACDISEIQKDCIKTTEAAIQTSYRMNPPTHCGYNMMDCPVVMFPERIKEKRSLLSYFSINRKNRKTPLDLYKMSLKHKCSNETLPKRLIFDLVDHLPKADVKTIGTNTKCCRTKTDRIHKPKVLFKPECNAEARHINSDCNAYLPDKNYGNDHYIPSHYNYEQTHKSYRKPPDDNFPPEKVDIYYFDHGNSSYYRTTDSPPIIMADLVADKTEAYTTRFWAEIFGTIHIGVLFITSFLLQLLRFLLHGIFRPLVIGAIQLISDYLFKPFLAVLFNGVVQPPLIFLYNVATSVRDFLKPIADSCAFFTRAISELCRNMSLVQIRKEENEHKSPKPV